MLYNIKKGDIFMTTTHKESKLEQEVKNLSDQIGRLQACNSKLLDEVATLKSNYTKLVEDVGVRLEAVHEKIFR